MADLKDNQIAQTVSALTTIAREYGQTQQLRERIAQVIVPILKGEGFPRSIVSAYAPNAPSSPSIEREAAAPSIEVPPGMSRIDAFFWLEHRAGVIEALAQKGLRVVSNADRVWLAPIEREVSGEASAEGVPGAAFDPESWPSAALDEARTACVTPCDGGKSG